MLNKIYVNSFRNIPYYLYKEITINTAIYDHLGCRKFFEFSIRVMNIFQEKKINNLSDILKIPEYEYLELNNFGKKSLKEVNVMLGEIGLKILKTKDDVRKFFLTKQRQIINEVMEEIKEMLSEKHFIDR